MKAQGQSLGREVPARLPAPGPRRTGAVRRAVPRSARRGFTLLEVMVAIAILGIISVTLYHFVDTTLRAARFSEKSGNDDAALSGLRRLVGAQLAAMPSGQDSALIGMTVRGKNGRRDAIQMLCPAGNAVLTPDARGFYQVTLDLREAPRGSGHYALGMERQPWSEDDDEEDGDGSASSVLKTTDLRRGSNLRMPGDWVKLMDGVQALEIAYFDARLNGWVDKWTDQSALPNLVRLRVATLDQPDPYEIVARVPGGGIKRVIPASTAEGTAANLLMNATVNNGTLNNRAVNRGTVNNGTVGNVAPPPATNGSSNTVLPNGFVVPNPPDTSLMGPRANRTTP